MTMAEFKQIHNRLYALEVLFLGVPLTLYLIHSHKTILIDAGISSTPEQFILPALAKENLKLDLLINTHGHVDHFGGNARLKDVFPDMNIAAHTNDAAWVEDHKRHFFEMYMCMPDDWQFEDGGKRLLELCGNNSAVNIHLEHGDTLELPPYTFQVFHSTGHSPGHIVLFDEKHKLAISGDVALAWGPKVAIGTAHQPSVYSSPSEYLKGVEMARSLNAELYCTAHFGAITQKAMNTLCDQSHKFVKSFDKWSLEALSDQPKTLHQIATEVASHIPSFDFGYHIHASTQAHLMQHVAKGRAKTVVLENRKHYLKSTA
jgi:glyoxylase-like metal-dependent hydrolase (beta-lactamase superfamily II)